MKAFLLLILSLTILLVILTISTAQITQIKCSDPDGLDYFNKGILILTTETETELGSTKSAETFTDKCKDTKTLIEYVCEDNNIKEIIVNCNNLENFANGICQDGICAEGKEADEVGKGAATPEEPAPNQTKQCTDHDNGKIPIEDQIKTGSYVEYGKEPKTIMNDFCPEENGKNISEAVCDDNIPKYKIETCPDKYLCKTEDEKGSCVEEHELRILDQVIVNIPESGYYEIFDRKVYLSINPTEYNEKHIQYYHDTKFYPEGEKNIEIITSEDMYLCGVTVFDENPEHTVYAEMHLTGTGVYGDYINQKKTIICEKYSDPKINLCYVQYNKPLSPGSRIKCKVKAYDEEEDDTAESPETIAAHFVTKIVPVNRESYMNIVEQYDTFLELSEAQKGLLKSINKQKNANYQFKTHKPVYFESVDIDLEIGKDTVLGKQIEDVLAGGPYRKDIVDFYKKQIKFSVYPDIILNKLNQNIDPKREKIVLVSNTIGEEYNKILSKQKGTYQYVKGYTFLFPGLTAYSVVIFGLEKGILAHELGHAVSRLCDEYDIESWKRREIIEKCPNRFPKCCIKGGRLCGNTKDCLGEPKNYPKSEGSPYSIMGRVASDVRIGVYYPNMSKCPLINC